MPKGKKSGNTQQYSAGTQNYWFFSEISFRKPQIPQANIFICTDNAACTTGKNKVAVPPYCQDKTSSRAFCCSLASSPTSPFVPLPPKRSGIEEETQPSPAALTSGAVRAEGGNRVERNSRSTLSGRGRQAPPCSSTCCTKAGGHLAVLPPEGEQPRSPLPAPGPQPGTTPPRRTQDLLPALRVGLLGVDPLEVPPSHPVAHGSTALRPAPRRPI